MGRWPELPSRSSWSEAAPYVGGILLVLATVFQVRAGSATPASLVDGGSAEVGRGRCAVRGALHSLAEQDGSAAARQLFDGVFADEGSVWPTETQITTLRFLQLEFPSPSVATQIVVQTDADSSFRLSFSIDGTNWGRLDVHADDQRVGMLTRFLPAPPSAFRFARLEALSSTHALAVGELQVSCDEEPRNHDRVAPSPPALEGKLLDAETWRARRRFGRPLLLAAALGLALYFRSRSGQLNSGRRGRIASWGVLALVSTGLYLRLPGPGPEVHQHEFFNYQLGTRYLNEVGYSDLYACALVAEAEAGFAERVLRRSYRDLETKQLQPGSRALELATECRSRFTRDRWSAFRRDVAASARAMGAEGYFRVLRDHGFNATPLVAALLRFFDDWGPGRGSDSPVDPGWLPHLDVGLLLIAFLSIGWGFGAEAMSMFIVAFCCNALAGPEWTSGAFLRMPSVVAICIGLAALGRSRHFLGGFSLCWSALLRVFPIVLMVPLLARRMLDVLTGTPHTPRTWRALWHGAISASLVAALWTLADPGWSMWTRFVHNVALHADVDSQNHVGLSVLLSYRPWTRAEVLFDPALSDPFLPVKGARALNLRALWPLLWVTRFGVLALLMYAIWNARRAWDAPSTHRTPDAQARAEVLLAVSGFCLFGVWFSASCYYYYFLAFFVLVRQGQLWGAPSAFVLLLAIHGLFLWGDVDDSTYAGASLFVLVWGTAWLVSVARRSSSAWVS